MPAAGAVVPLPDLRTGNSVSSTRVGREGEGAGGGVDEEKNELSREDRWAVKSVSVSSPRTL